MSDRPCKECIWNSDDGCTKWDCEPMTRKEAGEQLNIVRCKDCKYWQTEVAYVVTGRCKCEEMYRLICNKNFFCGYGRRKDG